MALKSEDILNVDIDPEFILSYELDKLSLESIQKDIFVELPEEITKSDKLNIESSNLETKSITIKTEDSGIDDCKNVILSIKFENDELNTSKIKEVDPELTNDKEDEKEEFPSFQNLNQLFIKLELSDSENEDDECARIQKLRERAPIRPRKQSSRNTKTNVYPRGKDYDKTQFSSERLRFLSGSSKVELNEILETENSGVINYVHENLPLIFPNTESTLYTFSSNDALYDDCRANSLSSPESGYETSNSISGGSPPPRFSVPVSSSLDLSVDEQNVLDAVFELENTTDYVSSAFNLLSCNIDEKDYVGKILNYLKDTPDVQDVPSDRDSSSTSEISVSTNINLNFSAEHLLLPNNQVQNNTEIVRDYDDEIYFLENSHSLQSELSDKRQINKNVKSVPIISYVDLNNSSIEPSSSSSKMHQKIDTPKKLIIKPLEDKAKFAFHESLSTDRLLLFQKQMYKKIIEDQNNKEEIKIIYIVDEAGKTSDNRTNLHWAVLNDKKEEIYVLVEIQKQYNKPFTDLNNRDKYGKTALDYAIQKNMTLVVEYLKENMACQSLNI